MADAYRWLNPPAAWSGDAKRLELSTSGNTDFWRETFYGFVRDSGHAFLRGVTGDFTAEVKVLGDYEALYDQAGLMLRLSETHWIKAGIEYTDGLAYFSVVVTNDTSDWSLVAIAASPDWVRIRLTRHAEAIRIQYLDASDGHWKPVRLAYFPPSKSADVGMMCCSPQREGFEVTFTDFSVGPAIPRDLHD